MLDGFAGICEHPNMTNYRFPTYGGRTFVHALESDDAAFEYANGLTDGVTPSFEKQVNGRWHQMRLDNQGEFAGWEVR